MITYESICKKIGFDPIVNGLNYEISNHEDDTQISPFSVLTYEELCFLTDYLIKNRDKLKRYTVR